MPTLPLSFFSTHYAKILYLENINNYNERELNKHPMQFYSH